ncbi:anti-sigma factor [Undibacterium sp. TJN19]|uniref:anti-sigma factor n=1 Tax=Undibacterium sp. TJN19 TaxID=3413055 RepID=UPI003BF262C3
MNLLQLKNNPSLLEKLASEYVLGSLRGGARRRFELWLKQDAALLQVVRQWESHLLPMAEFAPKAQPSAQVWPAIEKQLGLSRQKDPWAYWRSWGNLREDLAFWRGLGLFSSTIALVLVTVLLSRQADQAQVQTSYIASLADDKAQAVAIITGDTRRGQLQVRMVAAQNIAADKSLELWAVGKDGKVKSLGLLADNGSMTLKMPAGMTADNVPLLAVTLEPKGGSGNPEKPSGPIIFKGNWIQI